MLYLCVYLSGVVQKYDLDGIAYVGDLAQALSQLVAAACQVGDLGGVARQLDGFVVRRARLLTAAQPAQQVGAGRMVGVIAGQLVLKTVDGRQCHLRAVKLGHRDGPVEGDDRRGVEADELVVEGDDLRPVGVAYVAGAGVHGADRCPPLAETRAVRRASVRSISASSPATSPASGRRARIRRVSRIASAVSS